MLNLLTDPCFPVLRADGTRDVVGFAEVAEKTNPIVDFRAPRPDFHGAMVQLWLGLLQTALMHEGKKRWLKLFLNPPGRAFFEEALAPYRAAFELFGTGPRFMQDLELDETAGEPKSVEALLIEAPGGNTVRLNTDHFIKRGGVTRLSPFWTAIALFCLQTNAPAGGVGHRTGLRGGGPLTTLIKRPTLWQTLMLGVLEETRFFQDDAEKWRDATPEQWFPWLVPTRDSSKKGSEINPNEAHPLLCYWAMPRRIRLLAPEEKRGSCDLSGECHETLFHQFVTKNYGNNYAEGWRHPLTPHYTDAKDLLLPIHGQPGSLAYHHWLGLLFEDTGKRHREPARIVLAYVNDRRSVLDDAGSRLWVFGYDMDNMKARSWIDATMPIILQESEDPERKLAYEERVAQMIGVADYVAQQGMSAYKAATFPKGTKGSGDLSFVRERFWQATQQRFYQEVKQLAAEPGAVEPRERWLSFLFETVMALFDDLLKSRPIEVADPEPIAEAWRSLRNFTWHRGRKIREIVGLAPYEKPQKPQVKEAP